MTTIAPPTPLPQLYRHVWRHAAGMHAVVRLLHGPARVMERSVARRVRAPLARHDPHHSGDLQHRIGQASGALCDFTQNQFLDLQNAINLAVPSWGLVVVCAWSHGRVGVGGTGAALTIGSLFLTWQYAQQAARVIGSMAAHHQNLARTRTDFASGSA